MPETMGLNHLGLAVRNLEESKLFFTELLGWQESGYDETYPRTAVSDGHIRVTLWQVDCSQTVTSFDRRKNVGLHHLALQVETEEKLNELYVKLRGYPGVEVEFSPEPMGQGPRKHMMCTEPGGIRIEFTWQGK